MLILLNLENLHRPENKSKMAKKTKTEKAQCNTDLTFFLI
jgi:hypothetical protein